MKSARVAVAALCLLAGAIGGVWVARQNPLPRFVLVVCVDCLRPDMLGYGGGENAVAPHMNHYARAGIVWENAYASGHCTITAIASLFTGLDAPDHKATSHLGLLPPEPPVLAELYRAKGYTTAGFVNHGLLRPGTGFERGFDAYEFSWYDATAAAQFAAWHEQLGRSQPAFVYIHLRAPHEPYEPPAEYVGTFGPTAAATVAHESAGLPWNDYRRAVNLGKITPPTGYAEAIKNLYRGEVRAADDALGSILVTMQSRLDEAFVVIISDHGDNLLENGWLGHGDGTFFAEQIRVAMIMRPPCAWNVQPLRHSEYVATIDAANTLAALVGTNLGTGRNLLGNFEPRPVKTFATKLVSTVSPDGQTITPLAVPTPEPEQPSKEHLAALRALGYLN